MKEFIKEKVVELYETSPTDIYGQIKVSSCTPSIFGTKRDKVEEYCKEHPGILEFSTYGASYGNYKAFRIIDAEILKECNEALGRNLNYLRNVNKQW